MQTTKTYSASSNENYESFSNLFSLLAKIDKRIQEKQKKVKKEFSKSKDSIRMLLFFLLTTLSLDYCSHVRQTIKHMIDTVVLLLSNNSFQIIEPDKFEPSAQWLLENPVGVTHGIQSKQNPTKQELLNGIYKPRLTLLHRFSPQGKPELMLKIELSLPKLLFGNNFDELRSKDLLSLTQRLAETLKTMGVITSPFKLSKAPICAIHYSKNIPLIDGSTPYHIIKKIKEANIKLSLDVNQTDYRNDGHSYKWHCNSYEVVFYDKVKDLEKAKLSSKRAIEKDSHLQLNLFDHLQERKRLEILRIEVRLNKRQKIKQLFNILDIKSDFTFKSLFKVSISKKILLHYLNELETKRPLLLDYRISSDKALLAALIFNNPTIGPKRILQLYGLKKALDTINIRELRVMFAKYNQRSWYRLIRESNTIKLPQTSNHFSIIREHIMKFKPLKLASLI